MGPSSGKTKPAHSKRRWSLCNIKRPRLSPFTLGAILSLTVGAASGLGALGFRFLIDGLNFLFFVVLRDAFSFMGRYDVLLLPAIGGIFVGLLIHFFAREAKGHGVPEVMLAVSQNGGRIRGRVAVVKSLASSICIGSGGSVGREGPIVQIGSSVGSFLGQKFGVSATWLRVLVACGAAGGISATFNAPIAGVFFALEVILQTFSVQYFGVVVISSVTASVVAQAVLGDFPAFEIPLYNLNSFWELALFTVLGVLAALVGLGFMRILYFMEDRFDSVRWFPEYCKPVVGGLAVGLIGVFYPQVFGVGYDAVTGALTDALNGGFTLQLLVALALMKILATSLTLGSGGSGGVFAPSLFIGAMAGTAYGKAAQLLFPGIVVSPGAYGLVGMAAVFAGAAWAPITSIIIVFEMTRDYNIILPLMLAVVVSTFISRRLSKDSIYTLKLRRRGIDLMSPSRRAGIDTILAGEIMLTAYPHIQADEFVQDIAAKFEETGMHGFPILSDGGELVGIVTTTDVEHAMANGFQGREALDIATRSLITAFTDQTISDVLSQPGAQEVGYIPVVDRIQPRTLLGVLRREDIIRAYVTAVSNGTEEDSLE